MGKYRGHLTIKAHVAKPDFQKDATLLQYFTRSFTKGLPISAF